MTHKYDAPVKDRNMSHATKHLREMLSALSALHMVQCDHDEDTLYDRAASMHNLMADITMNAAKVADRLNYGGQNDIDLEHALHDLDDESLAIIRTLAPETRDGFSNRNDEEIVHFYKVEEGN